MNGGLGTVALASLAFAIGGALMKLSHDFSRLWPSLAVAVVFVAGAALLARAIQTDQLATVYVVGLGIEAIITVALGMLLFGERLTIPSACGIILIAAGVTAIRQS
jgi:small multidrug resistance pump